MSMPHANTQRYPATTHANVLQHNVKLLSSGAAVIRSISGRRYASQRYSMSTASVGQHIRHIVDHYVCFLDGIEAGRIDYTKRSRCRKTEEDRQFALQTIEAVKERLLGYESESRLTDELGGLSLSYDIQGSGEQVTVHTTPVRELMFLLSHTIHHYSSIALLLRSNGIAVPDSFGVSPSTVRYREKQDREQQSR